MNKTKQFVGQQYPSLTLGNVNIELVIPEGVVPDNLTAKFINHTTSDEHLIFKFALGGRDHKAKFHYGYGSQARLITKRPKNLRTKFGRSRITYEIENSILTAKVAFAQRQELRSVSRKKAPTPDPIPTSSWTPAQTPPAPKRVTQAEAPTSYVIRDNLAPSCLEQVQLKLLVQELNRRTREDDNITMEVTKEGTLRLLVEYQ